MNRLPPALAVIERQTVHVHADEAVRARLIEAAAELHGMAHGFVTMIEAETDAVVKQAGKRRDGRRAELALDDIAAKRQRQPAGAIGPPLSEVDDLPQPFVLVRDLTLVNQQTGGNLAGEIGRAHV